MSMTTLRTFLLEYKRDITEKNLGDKLVQAARDKNDSSEDLKTILDTIEKCDPTKNKQYVEWLCRQYIKEQFRLEDVERVKDVLEKFNTVKNRMPGDQRDIGKYDFRKLEDKVDELYNANVDVDGKEDLKSDIPGLKVLYKGPLGMLAIPTTYEAACAIGSGTRWCTAMRTNRGHYDYYTGAGPLYVWVAKNGDKFQFHFQKMQFMDVQDHPITPEQMMYFRRENPITKKIFAKYEKEFNAQDIAKSIQLHRNLGPSAELEAIIIEKGTPRNALDYARTVTKGRWKEGEPMIANSEDGDTALQYATEFFRGKGWPEGEKAIAKSAAASFTYATKVLKSRFEPGEAAIADNAEKSIEYAKDAVQGRWKEGEKVIIKSTPQLALKYAKEVVKGAWKEGEGKIAEDGEVAYDYAMEVLQAPFPPGEDAIAKSPLKSFKYAKKCLKGPFPKGEAIMRKHSHWEEEYEAFLKTVKKAK